MLYDIKGLLFFILQNSKEVLVKSSSDRDDLVIDITLLGVEIFHPAKIHHVGFVNSKEFFRIKFWEESLQQFTDQEYFIVCENPQIQTFRLDILNVVFVKENNFSFVPDRQKVSFQSPSQVQFQQLNFHNYQ